MHIVSDKSLMRVGLVYRECPGGGWIGHVPADPFINWTHIDGPLLYYSDGQLHWLTLWERLRCWLSLDDARTIQMKRRPDLTHADT